MTHEEMLEEAAKRESEDEEQEIDDQQEGGEPEATTDKAFEDGISELNGMENGIDNVYVEVPKVNLDKSSSPTNVFMRRLICLGNSSPCP